MARVIFAVWNGKVWQSIVIECHGGLHKFPADSADDLVSPGKKYARESDTARSGSSAKLAPVFYKNRFSSCPTCLNGRNHSGGSSANDQNIGFQPLFFDFIGFAHDFPFGQGRYSQRHGPNGGEGGSSLYFFHFIV